MKQTKQPEETIGTPEQPEKIQLGDLVLSSYYIRLDGLAEIALKLLDNPIVKNHLLNSEKKKLGMVGVG